MNRRIATALVVGAVVALAATSCSATPSTSSTTSPSSTRSSTSSPSSASPTGTAPVARIGVKEAGGTYFAVLGGMDWITVAGGSPWTSSQSIVRLDPVTGRVVRTIRISGFTCLAPDIGFGSLWFGVCGTHQVARIDPASGTVVATIAIPGVDDIQEESSVAAGAGGVWLLATPGKLVHVDPRTNKVVAVTAAPAGASAIRASKDALWITVHGDSTLLKVDPRTLKVVTSVPVGAGPRFLAVGGGAVWTLDQDAGAVTRVDLATSTRVATLKVDSGSIDGGDISIGGGFVWARVSDGLVAKIDPASNTVVARYGEPLGSGSVAADGTAAWITAHDSDAVIKLPLG